MAIEGPIRELGLPDLLQLLHLSRRSGALTASGGGHGVTTLHLDDGSLVSAVSSVPELRLGRLLVGSGAVMESQVESAISLQKVRRGERLGEILVRQGMVSEKEIERALRFQIDESVLELMRWQEGYLRFDDSDPPAPGRVAIRASTDAVLMEAARRLDELHELVGSHSLDPLPRLAEGEEGGYVHLSALDWEVLAEVDGARTLRLIAHRLGRPQLDVARSLYDLASAGIVEIGGSATERSDPMTPDVLLGQIEAAMEDGRIDDATALLHRGRALFGEVEVLVLEGRIAALTKDWNASSRAFAAAIAQEPDRPDCWYHLARIRLLQMDLHDADRLLERYIGMGDPSERRTLSAIRMIESIRELRRTAGESAP